jgi:Ser/Thr protein kinase RdoA (MazF antagonist)
MKERDFDTVLSTATRLYNINPEKIYFVGKSDNIIYEYSSRDTLYILRFTHSAHRTITMVKGEIDFLNYLADNNASVSPPVLSKNGNCIEAIPFKNSYYSVVAFEKARGIPANTIRITDKSSGFFQELGQVVGNIHALAKEYTPRHKRPEWHEDEFYYAEPYVPYPVIVEKSNRLIKYLHTLPKEKDSYGLIHGDINLSNIYVHNGRITLFDFDDSRYSWFAHDIAVALFYMVMDTGVQEKELFAHSFLKHFLQGYTKENKLSSFWLNHIPTFLALHVILCYNIITYECDMNALDEWCQRFMNDRRHAIENDIPFVDIKLP